MIQDGEGAAKAIELQNDAYCDQYNKTQKLAADGFKQLVAGLPAWQKEDKKDFIEYMKVRSVRDHAPKDLIVGIPDAVPSATTAAKSS